MSTQKDTRQKTSTESARNGVRWAVIAGIVAALFVGAYAFAVTKSPSSAANLAVAAGSANVAAPGAVPAGSSATPACACCGSSAPTNGGVTGATSAAAATVSGGVQKISVDLSQGYYNPNVITLAAGVPAEITFGQSSGCTGQVISQDLGFSENLTAGPRTVRIESPQKGTYAFSCGMQMVFGKIVVE